MGPVKYGVTNLAITHHVHKREAKHAARERARREQEAAEARKRYLAALARREALHKQTVDREAGMWYPLPQRSDSADR